MRETEGSLLRWRSTTRPLCSLRPAPRRLQTLCPHPALPCPAAIKLFYWSRLAYQQEAAGTAHKYVNSATGLPLFGLEHFESVWDDTTDTHCVLGWSGSQVVVAFRWARGGAVDPTCGRGRGRVCGHGGILWVGLGGGGGSRPVATCRCMLWGSEQCVNGCTALTCRPSGCLIRCPAGARPRCKT